MRRGRRVQSRRLSVAKYKGLEVAGKFIERIRKIQEEAKAVLGKAQEEVKRFRNRR